MTLIPENKTVLCEIVVPAEQEIEVNGFFCKQENLPRYKVISVSDDMLSLFNIGDIIICNSTGTKLNANSKVQYLFKEENIMGKVVE